MNPRREAWDLLGGEYDVRVLEPSPPADTSPPWFADDPLAGPYGTKIVTPVTGLGRSWDEMARDRPELAGYCAERWLGAWRRLAPLPRAYTGTRHSLHALAEHVVATARHAANGKIGLRFTRHGFGTPFFGDGHQIRVEGARLVVDGVAHTPATLGEAASLTGVRLGMRPDVYVPSTPAAPDTYLPFNQAAALALGHWFGFAWSALEQIRFDARAPGRVQLWPEHFDPAIDIGPEESRATFGASPGDDAHREPYLYISPWRSRTGEFWNDRVFGGASLPYAALLSADDQRATALAFFHRGLRELSA